MSGAGRGRALALLLLLCAPLAHAHTRSESFSSWRVDGEVVRARFSAPATEATRLGSVDDATLDLSVLFARHLDGAVTLAAGGEPCAARGPAQPLATNEGRVRAELEFRCGPGRPLALEVRAFAALVASHVHMARVARGDEPPLELVFSERAPRHELFAPGEGASGGTTFFGYVALGIEHIAFGPDHLAFLLSLLLFAGRARELLVLVTGFTLGHSLTLALGALGLARPEPAVIEALIGFTIALVAGENVAAAGGDGRGFLRIAALALAALGVAVFGVRGLAPAAALCGLALFTVCYGGLTDGPSAVARLRPALTLLFGLVHGFGFAGVLLELGLPRDRLVHALFGFNVGVELGQLAFVALFVAAVRLAPRLATPPLRQGLSSALLALGVYWFAERGYALLAP